MKLPVTAAEASAVAQRLINSKNAITALRPYDCRVEVIDPRLCQDTLDRLRPSLEAYKGCDLIDVNPGNCLWSQHLHDFLKPRRHVLVEPQRVQYGEFVEPLLADPSSSYSWTDKTLEEIIHGHEILGRPDSAAFGGLTSVNKKLLFNLNLTTDGRGETERIRGRRSLTRPDQDFLNDYDLSFYHMRSSLFARGLFRALVWTEEKTLAKILPRTPVWNFRSAVSLGCKAHITQVGGAASPYSVHDKLNFQYHLSLEDLAAGKELEERQGIHTPVHRQMQPSPVPEALLHPDVATLRQTTYRQTSKIADRLVALDAMVKKKDPILHEAVSAIAAAPLKGWVTWPVRKPSDLVVKEWLHRYGQQRVQYRMADRITKLAARQNELDTQWKAAIACGDFSNTHAYEEQYKTLVDERAKLPIKLRRLVWAAIDEYRAYDTKPLMWYRRPYNPLAFSHEESLGIRHQSIALLDINPDPNFRRVFDTEDKWLPLHYVLSMTSHQTHKALQPQLHQITPGAAEEFAATIPSLKDPWRREAMNGHDLRTRIFSFELWKEIGLSYAKWPFRMSLEGMHRQLTGLGMEIRAADEDRLV
jgi:mitochondrial transcription factor 1